jgi:hypothetical protein
LFRYNTQSYSTFFNETEPSNLLIEVTYTPEVALPHRFVWRQKEHVINTSSSSYSRFNVAASGSLTINPVKPSDTGVYDITAVISNDLGCENIAFNVQIECEEPKV